MDLLGSLRSHRRSPSAIFHSFNINYNPDELKLYIFVESDDDTGFYQTIFRRICDSLDIESIPCYGKNTLLSIRKLVDKNYSDANNIIFAVDKDFDDFLNIDNSRIDTFQTKFYSIENYLVNSSIIDLIWTDLYKLSPRDKRREEIIEKFDREYMKFSRIHKFLMAWALYCKTKNLEICLSNMKIHKYFDVSDELEVIKKIGTFSRFRRDTESEYPVNKSELKEIISQLSNTNHKLYTRGKSETWLFSIFLRKLEKQLKSGDANLGPKLKFQISKSNIIDILSSRIDIPAELREFFETVIHKVS